MPVLAVGGEKSFGHDDGGRYARRCDGCSGTGHSGSGHWLMEEQPAATVAAVRAFLDRQR